MKTQMNTYQRNLNRAAAMLLLPLGLAGCASLQENMDASRKEFYIPGKEIHVTDMRGEYRFCEVGLITATSKGNAIANIWNTTGTSDPTPDQFAALNPKQTAKEYHARKAWLNPVRHWTFDEFWCYEAGVERQFGEIKGTWMGVVGAEAIMKATVKGSYYPGYIYRNSKFKFNKGSEVYLLDAPDGEVFVMQSYTDHFDKRITKANLPNLGTILTLPAGWKFRTKVVEQDLTVTPPAPGHLAHVLQDNLHNTYEGSDGGKAFNFIP